MIGIIDGYTGEDNVFADIIGEYNAALFGDGDYVLKVGESLGYSIVSNNEIDIKDGVFVMQGRRGHIKKGTTEVCRIENGSQTLKRNDLIVIEYSVEGSTMVESFKVKVVKGTAGTNAVDPETVKGNIRNGDILHQMPLYRVRIEGLSITAVEKIFTFGSVAAETKNPDDVTESGYAADALAVKNKFSEQQQLIEAMGDQVTYVFDNSTSTLYINTKK